MQVRCGENEVSTQQGYDDHQDNESPQRINTYRLILHRQSVRVSSHNALHVTLAESPQVKKDPRQPSLSRSQDAFGQYADCLSRLTNSTPLFRTARSVVPANYYSPEAVHSQINQGLPTTPLERE